MLIVHLQKKLFSAVKSFLNKLWEEALVVFWKKEDKIAARKWWVGMAKKNGGE